MLDIPDSAFRAYDIRGIVAGSAGAGKGMETDLDAERVRRLGCALGAYFLEHGERAAVIGHDCRHSSPSLHDALADGLLSTGMDVTSLGMVPTPALYFGVRHLNRAAGVMITASHNPPQYNGFKIWLGKSTIHTTEIVRVRDLLRAGNFPRGRGLGCSVDIVPAYIDDIVGRFTLKRPMKAVVDGGNGAGGEMCVRVLERLGVEVVPLFCEPDGSFPNHHPDPVVHENMRQLIETVLKTGAELGIGLDGDGDRIGVCDAAGRFLHGDELLCLYARELLERKPGSRIIADIKSSGRLLDDITEHGGQGEIWRSGHSVMKARMLETSAVLAGEMSGHMFFSDQWHGFDDAIYAAARLIAILSAVSVPLTDLPGWPPACVTPELQIPCPDAAKFSVIEKARAFLREQFPINDLDGARATTPDGWLLARASNTQPALVLRYEASSAARIEELRDMLEPRLRRWITEAADRRVPAQTVQP